jgi:hypothetical protein
MIETDSDTEPNDQLAEFRKKRWYYWTILRKVREEYLADTRAVQHQFDVDDLETYIERNCGIKIHIVDGNITDNFDIVDEKLYIFCILRYT